MRDYYINATKVLTWAFIPLEHGVDVVPAVGVGAVEGDDVDDVEDHVDEAEEERAPGMLKPVRSPTHPGVHNRCHGLQIIYITG